MTRREFVGAAGMFALLNGGCAFRAPRGLFGGGDANLRFGVLSDVHIKAPGDEEHLLKALRFFRERGVDGVVVAGDIADTGLVSQLKIFADAWYSVFPEDKGLDGRHVEKLFVYGNHCVDGWYYGNRYEGKWDLAAKEAIGYSQNRAKVWEELFHEKYEPIWKKSVRGYTFIGAHWKDGKHVDIEEFMEKHGGEIDKTKPFFYIQHAHPKDTCFGSWSWGRDDGASTRALSKFPNAVAFSGHSHYTLTDERTIWQGAFTSINASSMKYASHDYSLRDNLWNINSCGYQGEKDIPKPGPYVANIGHGRQGMLVSVYDDRMVIERREFVFDNYSLGDDWIVPLASSESPYAYDEHAKRRTAPEFPADAKMTYDFFDHEDKKFGKCIRLFFPRAEERAGCRVFEYELSAVLVEDDVDLVKLQRRFLAPDFFLPLEKKIPFCECRVALKDLKLKGRYRFRAVPIECFGHKGAPIWSDIVEIGA